MTPRKFTDAQVLKFRTSNLTAASLANLNGVTRVSMWRLITGRTYSNAPGEPRHLKIGRPRRTDHGHQMSYRRGCRCDKCKCWRKLAARADRARRKAKAEYLTVFEVDDATGALLRLWHEIPTHLACRSCNGRTAAVEASQTLFRTDRCAHCDVERT